MKYLTIILLFSGIFKCESVSLTCSSETLVYRYEVRGKIFGRFGQKINADATVLLDCMGGTILDTKRHDAYDFVVRLKDVRLSIIQPKSYKEEDFCTAKDNRSCVENTEQAMSHPIVETVDVKKLTDDPYVIVQAKNGDILSLYFSPNDMNIIENVNFKKDVAAALQTRLIKNRFGDEDDEDIFGKHKSHIEILHINEEEDVVKKTFNVFEQPDESLRGINIDVTDETKVSKGKITRSSGRMFGDLAPIAEEDDDAQTINANEADVKIEQIAKSEVNYTFDLISSLVRNTDLHEIFINQITYFVKSSIKKEYKSESSLDVSVKLLSDHYSSLNATVAEAITLLSMNDSSQLEIIKGIIHLESELGLDKIKQVFGRRRLLQDDLIRASDKIFLNCKQERELCLSLVDAASYGYGHLVESRLLYLIASKSHLDISDWEQIVVRSMQLPKPSDQFVIELLHINVGFQSGSEEFTTILLATSSMGQSSSVSKRVKNIISHIIHEQLMHATKHGHCVDDDITIDALEAAGNMGDVNHLERISQIARICQNSKTVRRSLLHSVRRMLYDARVQDFLADNLRLFDCELINDLLETLISEMIYNKNTWPEVGVNEFDEHIVMLIQSQNNDFNCIKNIAIKYFERKSGYRAKRLFAVLKRDKRHKRGLSRTCSSWSGYHRIQSKNAFKNDRNLYNKRKHCLARIWIGPSLCHLNIYGGFFVGYKTPLTHCKGKLFTKLYSNLKLIKVYVQIGEAYGYWVQSNCLKGNGRVYLKVGSKVYFNRGYNTPSFHKKFSKGFQIQKPFFKYHIVVVTISFKAKLRIDFVIDAKIANPQHKTLTAVIKPSAKLTIGGSAEASIHVARAVLSVSVSLNYYIAGELKLYWTGKVCLQVYHGSDPNKIALKTYYQFRKLTWGGWKWQGKKYINKLSKTWHISKASKKYIYNGC